MNTPDDTPACILLAQAQFEERQRRKAAAALEAEAASAAKAATDDEAVQKLLHVFKTLPDSQECEQHPGQTAIFISEATSRTGRPIYRCPLCVGDDKATRRQHRIVSAGIPADVRHATLANFDVNRPNVKPSRVENQPTGCVSPQTFLAKAKAFHAREIRNLVLCGETGIGKGHLAAALAIDALDAGFPVVWSECSTLFRSVHQSYSQDGPEAIYNKMAGGVLFVLDEICFADLPKDGEEILFTVFDRRHKAGLQSILLGNAPAENVRKWLGARIVDRLRSGNAAFCYGAWASMRGSQNDGAVKDETEL